MELRHLRYFVAVAEEENVTRAARRLHVSQPPLTRQIRELEEALGVALFERNGRSIRLTDEGRLFLDESKAALKRVEQAVEAVRAAAGRRGELHVGYAPTPATEVLPGLLRSLERTISGVRIRLHDHTSPEMLSGLREGRLHAAILMQPTRQAVRGLHFEELVSYPAGVAVPPEHRFGGLRRVTPDEVVREPLVAYAKSEYPDYHAFLERILGRRTVRRLRIVEEADGGPSLMAAVTAGRGICICPSVFVGTAGKRLKFVPIDSPQAVARVGLAFRPENPSILLQALVTAAREWRGRGAGEKAS